MTYGGIARLAPLRQQQAPLRNKITTALRDAIESGVLEPGARLIEKELCEQLDVSRTSLREALRELQADGMVEQTSNRSLTVTTLSPDDAENAYAIRSVLEAMIVEQFIAKATDADIKQLVREGDAMKSAYRSGSVERMLNAKRAFYERLCAGAENMIAFDIIHRLMMRTASVRMRAMVRKERQVEGVQEMEALVKAIQKRDVVAARLATTDHIAQATKWAIGALAEAAEQTAAQLKKA